MDWTHDLPWPRPCHTSISRWLNRNANAQCQHTRAPCKKKRADDSTRFLPKVFFLCQKCKSINVNLIFLFSFKKKRDEEIKAKYYVSKNNQNFRLMMTPRSRNLILRMSQKVMRVTKTKINKKTKMQPKRKPCCETTHY